MALLLTPDVKRTYHNTHSFLRLAIEFIGEEGSTSSSSTRLTVALVKRITSNAVNNMFGLVGAGRWDVQVLGVDAASATALLAVCKEGLVPVRSAITLYGVHNEKPCRITVVDSQPFLLSMASP